MSSRDPLNQGNEFLDDTGFSDVTDRVLDTPASLKEKVGHIAETASKRSMSSAKTPPILSVVGHPPYVTMPMGFPAAEKSPILHGTSRTVSNRLLPTFEVMTSQGWART